MSYKCRICDAVFDEPFVDDGAPLCPFCANPYFDELDQAPCSVCGGDRVDGEIICRDCGEKLVNEFRGMLSGLNINDAENEYLTGRIAEYGLLDLLEG